MEALPALRAAVERPERVLPQQAERVSLPADLGTPGAQRVSWVRRTLKVPARPHVLQALPADWAEQRAVRAAAALQRAREPPEQLVCLRERAWLPQPEPVCHD